VSGVDEKTAWLAGRRRRRVLERRRRAQRRRRNLLFTVAGAALAAGVATGAADGDGGGPPEDPPVVADNADVPTVTGFKAPVPILMYHAISAPPPGAAYPELFVPQDEFEDQVRWLAQKGYHAVTLDQVFAAWHEGEPIARNPVVLSFDDGLRSQHVAAFPAMRRLGWPGVLNLKLESVEQGELTEPLVTELVDAGWELDSHTLTHPDLTTLDDAALRRELKGSRRELITRFGEPVQFIAYPAGSYDERVVEAAKETGYRGAMTTVPGFAEPGRPFRLSRVRVDGGDGVAGLASKLREMG
jgi:peptidoglycan/xylan/chitin deacetylase (PgdA/CDA1 family)